MIVLLMGPHGSGKTTLVDALSRQGSAIRLRQYTTRQRRNGENDEYRFVSTPPEDALWRYTKAGSEYGFARSELAHLSDGSVGVVAVHTEANDELKRSGPDFNILTVGLDTLVSHAEQVSRVNHIQGRIQSLEAFELSRTVARAQDMCLARDFGFVLNELTRIIEQRKIV